MTFRVERSDLCSIMNAQVDGCKRRWESIYFMPCVLFICNLSLSAGGWPEGSLGAKDRLVRILHSIMIDGVLLLLCPGKETANLE